MMNYKAILSDSIVYLKGIIGETKKEEAKLAVLATKDRYLVFGINETRGYQSNVDNVNTHRYHRMSEVLIENVPESCTEDRDYEVVITYKPYDQRAVLKFAQYTGAHPIEGRYTPGTFTNQCQTSFSDPRLLILTNPRIDLQPIKEVCLFWLLARMVSQMCGTILLGQKWDVMVNLFFYIEPEETKEQEEEAPVYTEGFLWRLRHSILASYLIFGGVEWTVQLVAVAVEADGNGWDDAPAPLIVSGCSLFVNAYRPSMPVLPRSCELLDWYGATVAYGTLQQGGRASRDFYNILIDEIVHVTENGPLEDVVAGEIIVWEKSCTVFI
ncbi:hypothetical protein GIB67_019040 [Kingdonia uniflora]|uniref:Uncharacterized protein n=1 Tax=Kingdonia uniflora TaxID=39325 RepID=A0A7J7MZB5_9MAGN|nr:hypothetical protein GIB67_019040 [Kingdonia uniflora]